jgi:transcription initiation factor TFIIIB Brf1 subunit/transcription initiation factor TFIIB
MPVSTLREIAKLFPTRAADALDDWQRAFVRDQLQRLEKWGDDIRMSDKQAAALTKALAAMQSAAAAGGDGGDA